MSSPKDLESLQRELASLAKRQADLEDVVLEVMERREATQERVRELTDRLGAIQAKVDDATARRDAAHAEIDAEVATISKERELTVADIPEALVTLYDRIRTKQGGVGAARLYQRRCEGCRLELDITEMNEVRSAAADAVVRCENCSRILVRTPDSGL